MTTNYDHLLERALLDAKRKPHVVVTDNDVSTVGPSDVAVIKLHRCVSRPETIIEAKDEYGSFLAGSRLSILC